MEYTIKIWFTVGLRNRCRTFCFLQSCWRWGPSSSIIFPGGTQATWTTRSPELKNKAQAISRSRSPGEEVESSSALYRNQRFKEIDVSLVVVRSGRQKDFRQPSGSHIVCYPPTSEKNLHNSLQGGAKALYFGAETNRARRILVFYKRRILRSSEIRRCIMIFPHPIYWLHNNNKGFHVRPFFLFSYWLGRCKGTFLKIRSRDQRDATDFWRKYLL